MDLLQRLLRVRRRGRPRGGRRDPLHRADLRIAAAEPPPTALEIAAAVGGGSRSAVEVTRRCLERIERLEPDLGAFQLVRAERALAEAKRVDERPDRAGLPLAGVPVAVKDNFDVAGEPTRFGSRATPAAPAAADDELVRRLRDAGAVVIGKTRMPELAIFGFTESAFGITRNPWNRERSPGGSTGGGAAAVAAGMAPLALGTDGLGSIRGPASFCGVFGLKPTRGLLPLMGGAAEHWYGLSVTGPIATTVRDAALMLDVLAASHAHRDVRPPAGRLRVALSLRPPTFLARLAEPVAERVTEAARVLEAAGHAVAESDPPYPATLPNWLVRKWLAGVAQDSHGLAEADLEKRTRTMARWGRRLGPGSDRAFAAWAALATGWFRDFDVALTPVVARPSIPAEGFTGRGFIRTALPQIRTLPYTQAWNAAGFPAAAVPFGTGPEGVPIAVQVIALPGNEARILSVAAQLEELRPWPRTAPAR